MAPVSQGRQWLETKALEAREGVPRNVEGIWGSLHRESTCPLIHPCPSQGVWLAPRLSGPLRYYLHSEKWSTRFSWISQDRVGLWVERTLCRSTQALWHASTLWWTLFKRIFWSYFREAVVKPCLLTLCVHMNLVMSPLSLEFSIQLSIKTSWIAF